MKIEHIAMYVADLDNTRLFFEKYFGAKSSNLYHNKVTGFKSYFLSFGDCTRLEIMTKPDVNNFKNSISHIGYNHVAFSVGSAEKVDELTDILKNDGYEVLSGPRTTGAGYYESVIIGIDGNLIEITV